MADFILSLILFFGGGAWALLCVLAGAHHPTGEMPVPGVLIGAAVAVAGAVYFVITLVTALA